MATVVYDELITRKYWDGLNVVVICSAWIMSYNLGVK